MPDYERHRFSVPLPPSRIAWLREQSRAVAAAADRRWPRDWEGLQWLG